MDNQHRYITGYQDFPPETVNRINKLKEVEQIVTDVLEAVAREAAKHYNSNVLRHLSIARTELETGFMYLVKAVARPTNGLANAQLHGFLKEPTDDDSLLEDPQSYQGDRGTLAGLPK